MLVLKWLVVMWSLLPARSLRLLSRMCSGAAGNSVEAGTQARVPLHPRNIDYFDKLSDQEHQPEVLETLAAMRDGRQRIKARQHVNPLSPGNRQPAQLTDNWYKASYADPTRPLHLDIGCAKGTFIMDMAEANSEVNYLGLEIRRPVVALALTRAARRNLSGKNCHVLSCNANVDLDRILTTVTSVTSLQCVSIQFPDPHFKKRHHKRRVLQPELVSIIEKHLSPRGQLFMQGDILDVMTEMRDMVRECSTALVDTVDSSEEWMSESNPMGIATEREVACQTNGKEVYRCLFRKGNQSP